MTSWQRVATTLLLALCTSLAVAAGPGRVASAQSADPPAHPMRHAAWIGHGWVNGTPEQTVPDLLNHLVSSGVRILMVNMGRLDETGRIEDEASTLDRWLDQVSAWEQATGQRLEIWAWLSAKTFRTNLMTAEVRQNIAGEAGRLMALRGPAGRGFDGVITDIEPVGLDKARFDAYIQLVGQIRAAVGPNRPVGVAGPRFSASADLSSEWFWGPDEFQRMAQHADMIVVNTYNTALRGLLGVTGADYQAWITDQTRAILAAVAGHAWQPARPQPRAGFRLFLSAPAYPPLVHESGSVSHDPAIENTRYAVRGIRRAIVELQAAGSGALRYLAGIALYGHTDGTGSDGYAGLATDWAWWQEELRAPDPVADPADGSGRGQAVWLGQEWLSDLPPEPIAAALDRLLGSEVRYLLVDMGLLDPSGRVPTDAATLERFIAGVQEWERTRGERITLWAWLPAHLDQTDILLPAVRTQIAQEAARLVTVRGPGGRRFEGIATAFWPVGGDLGRVPAYMELLVEVHRTAGWQTAVGVSAPLYSPQPTAAHQWGPSDFYYIARRTDFMVMNLHHSGLTTAGGATVTDYAEWAADQARGVIKAVSGTHWQPARPGPRSHFRLLYSTQPHPAQGASPAGWDGARDPALETPETATRALQSTLAALQEPDPAVSAALVQGMLLPAAAGDSRITLLERLRLEPNVRRHYDALVAVEMQRGLHWDLDTFVGGRKVPWDVRPFIESGRTQVPVRKLAEALGATVVWDEAQQTITITRGDRRILLTIGSQTATVDGRAVPLDVPPRIVPGGRTVIPLRFVSEHLGLYVTWLEQSRTIVVTEQPLTNP